MTAIARMAVLNLRTVAPYRSQGLVLFGLVVLIFAKKVPAPSTCRSLAPFLGRLPEGGMSVVGWPGLVPRKTRAAEGELRSSAGT